MCRCVSFRNRGGRGVWRRLSAQRQACAAGAPPRGGRAFDAGRSRPCGAAGSRPSARRAPLCRGNRVCGAQGGPPLTPLTSSREGACHELSAVAQDTLAEGHCCHPPARLRASSVDAAVIPGCRDALCTVLSHGPGRRGRGGASATVKRGNSPRSSLFPRLLEETLTPSFRKSHFVNQNFPGLG